MLRSATVGGQRSLVWIITRWVTLGFRTPGGMTLTSPSPAPSRRERSRLTSAVMVLVAVLLIVAHLLDPSLLLRELVYAGPLVFRYW